LKTIDPEIRKTRTTPFSFVLFRFLHHFLLFVDANSTKVHGRKYKQIFFANDRKELKTFRLAKVANSIWRKNSRRCICSIKKTICFFLQRLK
jgi:hypothetical protein